LSRPNPLVGVVLLDRVVRVILVAASALLPPASLLIDDDRVGITGGCHSDVGVARAREGASVRTEGDAPDLTAARSPKDARGCVWAKVPEPDRAVVGACGKPASVAAVGEREDRAADLECGLPAAAGLNGIAAN